MKVRNAHAVSTFRLRRLIALAFVASLVALVLPVGAANAADNDNATITASVNETLSLAFTDATAAFGAVNPGTTNTLPDELAYTVSTNAAAGFHVNVTATASTFPFASVYIANTPAGPFNDNIGSIPGAVSNNHRTSNAAGTFNYLDSVRFVVPANQNAGSFSATLNYLAIAN